MRKHQYHAVIRYKNRYREGAVLHLSAKDPKVLAQVIAEGHLDERFYRSSARMVVEIEVFPPSESVDLDSNLAPEQGR